MKYLAFDYGLRRIGVAASDPTGTIVRPVLTIDRKIRNDALRAVKEQILNENPDTIVFGLPLSADDEESELCLEIRRFTKKLKLKYPMVTQPIEFYDESYSSVKTHSLMIKSSSKKRRRNKANIDKIAACFILEGYLREQSGSLLLY